MHPLMQLLPHQPQLNCLILFILLHVHKIKYITVIKMPVITVLIIAVVANIILVAVVAIAWKNCECSKPATVSCRIYLQCSLSSSLPP